MIIYEDTQDARVKKLGDVYHARFSCKGQRVQKSLHTKNFKIAVQVVEDIQRAILLGEDWQKEKELFQDLWPAFLEAKAQGKQRGKKIRRVGEKTLKEYIHFGDKWYLPFFSDTRVDRIDGEMWDEYLAHVREHSRSKDKTKILNHWKYLSGFMSWCVAMGYIKRKPDIYNPDQDDEDDSEDGVGINFTDEQLKWFRDGRQRAHELADVAAPKLAVRLWIYMAQFMGMRSFEISQLPKSRIDLAAMLIRLGKKTAKGGRPRQVPIHPAVLPLLNEQLSASGDSPYLFPNRDDASRPMDRGGFKKPWTSLRQDLGIEGRFHDFRHSYATRAFSNPELNPVVLCSALGMSMNVAMKVYIHFDETQLKRIPQAFRLSEVPGENLVNEGRCG